MAIRAPDGANKNLGERSTIERQDLDNRAAAVEFTIYPTPLLDQGLIIAFKEYPCAQLSSDQITSVVEGLAKMITLLFLVKCWYLLHIYKLSSQILTKILLYSLGKVQLVQDVRERIY